MPNRHGSTGDYRYGFNGKEKDDEVKGEGNSINYEARIYDSRVCRFLSIDPLREKFPWYSPYQFAGNKPIVANDLDGLEERIIILSTVQGGGVRREVLDFKTLQRKVEMVGVANSARYSSITQKEFMNHKKAYWDAFSNSPELFASGFQSYTIGMNKKEYKNTGFTGMFKGELTISAGNSLSLSYKRNLNDKPKPSTFNILKDATDPKKNPEMVKGIDTAKDYVSAVSLVVSGPALLTGKAGIFGYAAAGSDIDQLTGASAKLNENCPQAKPFINGAKLTLDLLSVRNNFNDINFLNRIPIDESSKVFPDVIIGTTNTTGDIQENAIYYGE